MAIRGGSAGGYTTLAALSMRPVSSPPAPATTASPTSARSPPRRTSSSPATSTAWSRRGRRAPTSTPSARRSTTWTRSTPRWRCSRATRTRWSRRTRQRRSSRRCGPRACRTPTCCSPASSTASARRRTSGRLWMASCRSTRRSGVRPAGRGGHRADRRGPGRGQPLNRAPGPGRGPSRHGRGSRWVAPGVRTSRRAAISSSCGWTATASSPSIRGPRRSSGTVPGAGTPRRGPSDPPGCPANGSAGDEVAEPGGLAHDHRHAPSDHSRDAVLEPPHDGVQPRGSRLERQVARRQVGRAGPASGLVQQPEEDVAVQALPAQHHVAHQPDVAHRRAAAYTSRTVGMIIGRRR